MLNDLLYIVWDADPVMFTIGGFEYEWVKLGTIEFTNASGYMESYDVWQHPQDVTGSMTVTVS